jgi:hypothetical protein
MRNRLDQACPACGARGACGEHSESKRCEGCTVSIDALPARPALRSPALSFSKGRRVNDGTGRLVDPVARPGARARSLRHHIVQGLTRRTTAIRPDHGIACLGIVCIPGRNVDVVDDQHTHFA